MPLIGKFLADENVPRNIVRWLQAQGHDVVHAADVKAAENDIFILRSANLDDRIVVTFDQDFGQLIFRGRMEAKGVVLFRVGRQSLAATEAIAQAFFSEELILAGYFTVVSPGHIRRTKLPE